MAEPNEVQQYTPGQTVTLPNGLMGMVLLNEQGQQIIYDINTVSSGNPIPIGSIVAGQPVSGAPVGSGSGNPAPPAAPTGKASMADFQLPWYGSTYQGDNNTSFRNLYDQLWAAQKGHHDYGNSDFGRFHISHGGSGDQDTWEGWGKAPPTSGYPLPPQQMPGPAGTPPLPQFPAPVPPAQPYVPGQIPNGVPTPPGGGPSAPPTGGGNVNPYLSRPPVYPGGTPRTETPGGGTLPPPTTQPTRPYTPAPTSGGLLGHTPTPTTGGAVNPLLRTSTPTNTGLLGAAPPRGTPGTGGGGSGGVRVIQADARQSTPSAPVNGLLGGGSYTAPAMSTANSMAAMGGGAAPARVTSLEGFRFGGTDPYAKNYDYLADNYGSQIARQYYNVNANQLQGQLGSASNGDRDFVNLFTNTAGAGGSGSLYSGGGQSSDGSKFWTGTSGGLQSYNLPNAINPYAGTPLAALMAQFGVAGKSPLG